MRVGNNLPVIQTIVAYAFQARTLGGIVQMPPLPKVRMQAKYIYKIKKMKHELGLPAREIMGSYTLQFSIAFNWLSNRNLMWLLSNRNLKQLFGVGVREETFRV